MSSRNFGNVNWEDYDDEAWERRFQRIMGLDKELQEMKERVEKLEQEL